MIKDNGDGNDEKHTIHTQRHTHFQRGKRINVVLFDLLRFSFIKSKEFDGCQ